MKVLRIGDPHVTVSNLEDSEKLLSFIFKTAKDTKPDYIEFMGDLLDTHDVIRSRVLNFWYGWLKKISSEFKIIILVGNHDKIGDKSLESLSSLSTFELIKNVTVVNESLCIDNLLYVSYLSDNDRLIEICKQNRHCNTLIAHATFLGAQYENGFYADDGIDLSLIPQNKVISGHIHKSSTVGKCFYPGSPRWIKATDANQDKGIYLFDHKNDGSYSYEFFSTRGVVTPIVEVTILEDKVEEGESKLADLFGKVYVELKGSSEWISNYKKTLDKRYFLKIVPTDSKIVRKPSKKGISLNEYLQKNSSNFNQILSIVEAL